MKKEKLIEERTNLGVAWDKYKEHRDSLDGDQSTWTEENRTKFDKLDADVDKIEGRIQGLEKEIAKESKDKEREKRFEKENDEGFRPNAENRDVNKDEEVRSKIFDTFATGGMRSLSGEQRALMVGSDIEGGYLVMPQKMVSGLLKNVDDDVVIRTLATIHQLKKAKSLGVVKLDADLDDWDWTTELKTGSEDDSLKFGKRELRPHPVAKRVKISNTLIQNSSMGIQALVQDRMRYKLGGTLEYNYMLGDGHNKPLGLFTASADGISTDRDVSTAMAATLVTGDGLINVQGTLKSAYDSKAKWLMHRDLITMIRKLKTTDLQYIWQPGLTAGVSNTILGKSYVLSEDVPHTYTTGLYVGMYGDFSKYWIIDTLNMQMQVLNELYAETNQIGYIGRYEGDGAPVLEEAFVRIKLG